MSADSPAGAQGAQGAQGGGAPMSDRMQALLSRAVEDQLTEQRQVAGVLAEVRAQLARLAAMVEGRAGAETDSDLNDAVAAVSADVREGVRVLAERLDSVAGLVRQRGVDLSELKASIAQVHEEIGRHAGALDSVSGGLGAVPALGERVGTLQETLAAALGRLEDSGELPAALERLQQRAASVDVALHELRSAFAGIGARIADLPTRTDLGNANALAPDTVTPLTGRLDRLDDAVAALVEQVGQVATGLSVVTGRLEEVQRALAHGVPEATADAADGEALEALQQRFEARLAAAVLDLGRSGDLRAAALREELTTLREELRPAEDAPAAVTAEQLADAVAASEERLRAHVDDAVLALAEALLRRRARTGARGAASAPDDSDTQPQPEPEPQPQDAADEPDAGEAEQVGETVASPPWETPPPRADAAPPPPPPTDTGQRRRPWWRSGD